VRASRLLAIIITLQSKGSMTAQSLAERFEVSRRTIYRDLDELSAAGVPIQADRGVGGGITLSGAYRTDLSGLTTEEAAAFSLNGLPELASQLGLGIAAAAAGARVKLMHALGGHAANLASRFHLDPAEWYGRVGMPPHLRCVARAVLECRVLDIEYESWSRLARHVLEPLGLVVKSGEWYMLGRKRDRIGIYRINKIRSATLTKQNFREPPGFDLASAWRERVARFEKQMFTESADIVVYPDAFTRLPRLGASTVDAVMRAPAKPDGSRRATVAIEGDDAFAREMLGFGRSIQVVGPPTLCARIAALADDLVQQYPAEQ
jgi:predicted DNA-binding transcriptional regulator YafY